MQKIAVLYDASQAVLSTFDLDEVLSQILMIARDYFHLQNVAILLLDKHTQELQVRSQIGWDAGRDQIRLSLEQGITGAAARLKRPVYVPDVSKDSRYITSAQSTRSELAVPLMVRDQVVGVLDCQSQQLDFFDSDTIDLLTLFSTQASMALQNAHLYSLEQHRAAQLEAINAIAKQTTAVLDLKDLLAKVCSLVRQSFPGEHVSVLLRDDQELVLHGYRSHGGGKLCFQGAAIHAHVRANPLQDVHSTDLVWPDPGSAGPGQRPTQHLSDGRRAAPGVGGRHLRHRHPERLLRGAGAPVGLH